MASINSTPRPSSSFYDVVHDPEAHFGTLCRQDIQQKDLQVFNESSDQPYNISEASTHPPQWIATEYKPGVVSSSCPLRLEVRKGGLKCGRSAKLSVTVPPAATKLQKTTLEFGKMDR
ncbi:hypothetical protein OIU76_002924 [Salix suchowensis]|nr:hypothetical protein OIU76_002924 [Salix suchowensis]